MQSAVRNFQLFQVFSPSHEAECKIKQKTEFSKLMAMVADISLLPLPKTESKKLKLENILKEELGKKKSSLLPKDTTSKVQIRNKTVHTKGKINS